MLQLTCGKLIELGLAQPVAEVAALGNLHAEPGSAVVGGCCHDSRHHCRMHVSNVSAHVQHTEEAIGRCEQLNRLTEGNLSALDQVKDLHIVLFLLSLCILYGRHIAFQVELRYIQKGQHAGVFRGHQAMAQLCGCSRAVLQLLVVCMLQMPSRPSTLLGCLDSVSLLKMKLCLQDGCCI